MRTNLLFFFLLFSSTSFLVHNVKLLFYVNDLISILTQFITSFWLLEMNFLRHSGRGTKVWWRLKKCSWLQILCTGWSLPSIFLFLGWMLGKKYQWYIFGFCFHVGDVSLLWNYPLNLSYRSCPGKKNYLRVQACWVLTLSSHWTPYLELVSNFGVSYTPKYLIRPTS